MSNIPSQLKTTWRLRFSVIKLEIRKPSAYGGDDIQSGSVANQQFRIFTTRIRSDRNIRIFINAFRTSLVFCLCLSKAYTRAPVASSSTVDNFSRCEKKSQFELVSKHLCGVYWSRLFIFADFFLSSGHFHSTNRCCDWIYWNATLSASCTKKKRV